MRFRFNFAPMPSIQRFRLATKFRNHDTYMALAGPMPAKPEWRAESARTSSLLDRLDLGIE